MFENALFSGTGAFECKTLKLECLPFSPTYHGLILQDCALNSCETPSFLSTKGELKRQKSVTVY